MSELDAALSALAQPEFVIQSVAKKYGLPPEALLAIRQVESGGKPGQTSSAGAQGEFQIMPATAEALGVDPTKLRSAAEGAAQLILEGLRRYKGDWNKTLKAYHGGPNESNWGKLTDSYPGKIFKHWRPADVEIAAMPRDEAGQAIAPETKTPVAAMEAVQAGAQDWQASGEASIDAQLKALGHKRDPAPPAPAEAASMERPWSFGEQTANAAILGQAPRVEAAGRATRAAVEHMQAGAPLSDAKNIFSRVYDMELEKLQGSVKDWRKEHPWQAMGAEMLGSIPTVIGGMAAAGKVAAPIAQAISPAAANFLSGTAGRGGAGAANWLLRRGSQTAAGALQGATASGMASGMNPDVPIAEQMKTGAAVGGALGATLTPVVNALTNPLRGDVSPEVARIAQRAEQMGVKLAPWRLAQNPKVELAGKILAEDNPEVLTQFSDAVKKTIMPSPATLQKHGLPVLHDPKATLGTEFLNDVKATVGKMFDKVAEKTTLNYDAKLSQGINAIRSELLQDTVADPATLKAISSILQKVDDTALTNSFTIPGKEFQQLTQKGSNLYKALHSPNGILRDYAHNIREAIYEALDRSASLNVKALAGEAKTKWALLRRLESAVEATGASGVISPSAVAKAAKGLESGDLATLGQAARFIPEPTAAGTAKTGNTMVDRMKHAMWPILGIEGVAAYTHPNVGLPFLAGTTAVYGGRHALGKQLSSDWLRDLYIKQALTGQQTFPQNRLTGPGAVFLNRGVRQDEQ
jgi:hypothetical protein